MVGFDRHLNYHKIQTATLCIRENEGCKFIATNLDAVTHLTDAQEWAGNGAMVGAIKGQCIAVLGSMHCPRSMPGTAAATRRGQLGAAMLGRVHCLFPPFMPACAQALQML